MRISLKVTIELDAKLWAKYQGLNDGDDLREDVRSHFLNLIQCSEFLYEADGTATLAR